MRIRTITSGKEIKNTLASLRDDETQITSRQSTIENQHTLIFRLNETEETFSFKSSHEFNFTDQGEVVFEAKDKSLQFKTRLKEVRPNYVIAHYPEKINMSDTREYFRMNFSEKNKTIIVKTSKGATIKFKAIDISRGGLGLLSLEAIEDKIQTNDIVTIMTIGKSRTLTTPARVAFIKSQGVGNSKTYRVGLQVTDKYLFDEGLVSYFASQE